MRVIVAGSRTAPVASCVVGHAIKMSGFPVTSIVCGCAAGVDRSGEAWAKENGIPVVHFPADWDRHGRAAGPLRNAQMAKNADALVALWDGESRGTKNMIGQARARGLRVYVLRLDNPAWSDGELAPSPERQKKGAST